jgi:hypothetical protein
MIQITVKENGLYVVAVAYCDYVLLDSHWETHVSKALKRICAGKLSFHTAKVFSEKKNGIKKFLCELESITAK